MSPDIWWRIDQGAVAVVNGLELEDVKHVSSQIYPGVQGLTNAQFPAVVISQDNLVPRLLGRTSAAEEWRYPVRIWLLDMEPSNAKKQMYLTLLRTLAGAFSGKRLAGVSEVQFCEVDYEVAFDPRLPQYRHVVTGMVLWFRTKEAS